MLVIPVEDYKSHFPNAHAVHLYQYCINTGWLKCICGTITSIRFKDGDTVQFWRDKKKPYDRYYLEAPNTEGVVLARNDHYDLWLVVRNDEQAKSIIREYLLNHPRCKDERANRRHLSRLEHAYIKEA